MVVLNAGVTGVALDAVHDTVFHALYDAHMVGQTVALPIVKALFLLFQHQAVGVPLHRPPRAKQVESADK